MKETEQKRKEERARKEKQAREKKEREAREARETERRNERVEGNATSGGRETPSQNSVGAEVRQWLCEHYQRLCRVKFPCCGRFFPCHRCHNNSGCPNDNSKAREACYVECSICNHQQEINQDAHTCARCKTKFSAYFCSVCKHFTGEDKAPYHCTKCGICRIYKDRSFHCDVCNVCLDKRLEGRHSCRENSGHDECCICLEDAFSGCQILPCSHKVHRECAIAMIQNGV
ncbi:RING finger and CHY zinc finger domain-containing protein 1-like [Stylophora pistillata]|uniref:RING finger and CHY zinc finger domain-containing protein 1-like n=1 Tax=Stylophora pistillata TaxID=50429 RepID=UPI000C047621|nr:RING finger and CHY zinc finger domain-containing protein 1-like [Stylophora pistillata]